MIILIVLTIIATTRQDRSGLAQAVHPACSITLYDIMLSYYIVLSYISLSSIFNILYHIIFLFIILYDYMIHLYLLYTYIICIILICHYHIIFY